MITIDRVKEIQSRITTPAVEGATPPPEPTPQEILHLCNVALESIKVKEAIHRAVRTLSNQVALGPVIDV